MDMSTYLTVQPACIINGQLKDYQMHGINWMISLYELGVSGILADEMGLGKTIQTIAFLGFLEQFKNIKGKHLICAPLSTLGNWELEFKKWFPTCKVVTLYARRELRDDCIKDFIKPGKFDVVITSYQGISICLNELKKISWHYFVIDEAHRIKNEESQFSGHVRELKTDYRFLLTGTPLQNNLHELWALLNFIVPDLFNDSEVFDEMFNSEEEETMTQD